MRETKKFKIAHISDLHLTPNERYSRMEPDLFGRLKGMNKAFSHVMASKQMKQADCLLVSGDITDRGDTDTWSFFWETIEKAGFYDKCLAIPGNHDVCNLGFIKNRKVENKRTRIKRVTKGLRLGNQETKFPWTKQISEQFVIFGLDSCNTNNSSVLTNAIGEIGSYQLETFARMLKDFQNVRYKIVMLHHSPNIPETETEKRRGLSPTSKLARWGHEVPKSDRRGLRLLCITQDVSYILHGHLHRSEKRNINSIKYIGAPATTEPVSLKDGSHFFPFNILSFSLAAKNLRVNPQKVFYEHT